MRDYDESEVAQAVRKEFNKMRGEICGLIEAVGMPSRQERGAINTFKSLSYDAENSIVALISD